MKKFHDHLQFQVVLFLFLIVTIVNIVSVHCNSEGDALNAWKVQLLDPNNVLTSWDPTLVNPCTWFHVTCNLDNSVTRVDLGSANLTGPLVPQLGQLANLQYLEAYGNNLSGEIPVEIGNLTDLVSLGLSNNLLSGPIPSSLLNLKSLRYMRLDNNNISGSIPTGIGNLENLVSLDLYNNLLSGSIPSTLGNLKNLTDLRLNNNMLSGRIPAKLLSLIFYGHLELMDVSGNQLEGTSHHGNATVTTIIQDPKA